MLIEIKIKIASCSTFFFHSLAPWMYILITIIFFLSFFFFFCCLQFFGVSYSKQYCVHWWSWTWRWASHGKQYGSILLVLIVNIALIIYLKKVTFSNKVSDVQSLLNLASLVASPSLFSVMESSFYAICDSYFCCLYCIQLYISYAQSISSSISRFYFSSSPSEKKNVKRISGSPTRFYYFLVFV